MIALGAFTGLHMALLVLSAGVDEAEPTRSAPHARVPAALGEELAVKAAMNANEGSGRYTATTATVLVRLIDRIPRGGELKLSQAALADLVGVSRRTLQRHLDILETGGYIAVERQRVARDRMATHVYRLSGRVESMVYASGAHATVRQIGAGNKESVVVKQVDKTTNAFIGDESTHDPVMALVGEGFDEEKVRATIKYAEGQGNIQNPVGWARQALRNRWIVPQVEERLRAAERQKPGYWEDECEKWGIDNDEELANLAKRQDEARQRQQRMGDEDHRWETALRQLYLQLDKQNAHWLIGNPSEPRIRLVGVEGSTFTVQPQTTHVADIGRRLERQLKRLIGDVWGCDEVSIVWTEAAQPQVNFLHEVKGLSDARQTAF